MGNSLRCCLACVLPCGALDLIRIVHLNGYVDEITRPITAGEILAANPNHILSKPCSQGVILILSPESELKRGGIYFLIPESSVPESTKKKNKSKGGNRSVTKSSPSMKKKRLSSSVVTVVDGNDVSEKKKPSSRRDRRTGIRRSLGAFQPHLESISEDQ